MRPDTPASGALRGAEREVYLYCCDVRSLREIQARFPKLTEKDTSEILDSFLAEDLMFHENGRYLSLAMAKDATTAAARIARQANEVLRKRERVRLDVFHG
jgi:hypothetical protein